MTYLQFFQDGSAIQQIKFPETELGTSSQVEIEIKNPNDFPVMIVKLSIDDPDITLSQIPEVLEAFESKIITASFSPTPGRGPLKAQLDAKVMF